MNPRIRSLFTQKSSRILSVYFTAGYPQKEATMPILKALQAGGGRSGEIGIPLPPIPWPTVPSIQRSSQVALQNGMSLKVLLINL
jgi:tryptophan synthase alpha chain